MMEMIARLIAAALEACFDLKVIDWLPGSDNAPETFLAECEINFDGYRVGLPDDGYEDGDYHVELGNVLCFVGLSEALDTSAPCIYWHAEILPVEVVS